MAHQSSRIDQAGLDILRLQPGEFSKQGLVSISSRKHPQDVLYCEPPPADYRLTPKYLWVNCYPLQQLRFVHDLPLFYLSYGTPTAAGGEDRPTTPASTIIVTT